MKFLYIAIVAFSVTLLISEASAQGGNRGRGGGGGSPAPYTRLPQLDEQLADAANLAYGNRNVAHGESLETLRTTSDGKNVILELDILKPIPCELEMEDNRKASGAVLVQASAAVGSGTCTVKIPGGRGGRGGGGRGGNGGGNGGRGNDLGGNGRGFRRSGRSKRSATSDLSLRWPETRGTRIKTIAYTLTNDFEQVELNSIQEAIAEYNKYTCINFVPRRNEADYIRIFRDGGCYSYVGWQYWAQPNLLSLGRGCAWYKNIPIHELLHAIGVYHQQSRPDRDQHVRILLENVLNGQTHNFFKQEPHESEMGNTEYSYRSVMHYGRSAWSIDRNNLDTIITRDPFYQDIIGRANTFSFEDLQLINYIYKCDDGCPNTCPPNSYRDKNCICYCRNEADFDIPAVPCEQINECSRVGQPCNCDFRPDSCRNLQNTACNTNSRACECDSDSAMIDGQCIRISDITCTEVGQDCQCSRKDSTACNGLPNTVCDTGTNACECRPSHQLNGDGVCIDINAERCDRIGKPCFCSQKANGCSQLSNSYCDLLTDRCECDEDYYASGGVCARAPVCSLVGQRCECSVQGQDACSFLTGTVCDESTEACVCLSSYRLNEQNICVPTEISYISDGRSIAPFLTNDKTTPGNQFIPTQGEEGMFDYHHFMVAPNGWHLRSAGRGSGRYGVIETPPLPAGTWCIQYSFKLAFSALWVQTSTDGVNWRHRGNGASWAMDMFYPKQLSYRTDSQLYVRFQAEVHPRINPNTDWEVLVDPIVIKRC